MNKAPILLFILVIPLVFTMYSKFSPKTAPVHYHAGFNVYMDGVKQDYSDFKYMNIDPCTEHQEKQSSEKEQIEKAHLHEGAGDVVHIHRTGAVWGDLFRNLGVSFPPGKPIAGFIGGEKVDNILTHPIDPGSSVIIISGKADGIDSSQYVSPERIREIESQSELCGQS